MMSPGKFVMSIGAGAVMTSLLLPATPAMAQANETVALSDMQTMANAMELVAIDTSRYVSLENLNDLSATNTVNPFDSIKDQGGVFTMFPQDGYFLPRRDLTVGPLSWQGPYVTYQQARIQTGTTPYDQGSLLDPWGTPYYLFNPFGLLRGDQGVITQELYGDRFDRYTIVSLGPDGEMSSDDLAYSFGGGVNSSRLTSARGTGVTLTSAPQAQPAYEIPSGTQLTLRGTNFGAPGTGNGVYFGETPLESVVTWTNRSIVVSLPPTLTGTNTFTVQLTGGRTNGLQAHILAGHNSATGWELYN